MRSIFAPALITTPGRWPELPFAGNFAVPRFAFTRGAASLRFFLTTNKLFSNIYCIARYSPWHSLFRPLPNSSPPTSGRPRCARAAWKWRSWPAFGTARLYGLEILRVLERDSSLVLAEGTIYPILNRLRAEGLVQSQWVEAEAGHPRKYYQLTQSGTRASHPHGRDLDAVLRWTRLPD